MTGSFGSRVDSKGVLGFDRTSLFWSRPFTPLENCRLYSGTATFLRMTDQSRGSPSKLSVVEHAFSCRVKEANRSESKCHSNMRSSSYGKVESSCSGPAHWPDERTEMLLLSERSGSITRRKPKDASSFLRHRARRRTGVTTRFCPSGYQGERCFVNVASVDRILFSIPNGLNEKCKVAPFNDEEIRHVAERFMAIEENPEYRKKYATVWRENRSGAARKASALASAKCTRDPDWRRRNSRSGGGLRFILGSCRGPAEYTESDRDHIAVWHRRSAGPARGRPGP